MTIQDKIANEIDEQGFLKIKGKVDAYTSRIDFVISQEHQFNVQS